MQQSSVLSAPEAPPAAPGGPEFKPTAGRARATIATFYVFLGAALFTIGADVYGLMAVDAGLADEPDADQMLRTSDTLDTISAVGGFLVLIVLAVLFLRWFYRSYKNLPALGVGMPPRSAGWAVGSWFVPFVNWVVPLLSANDIWRSGDTEAPASEPWYRRPVSWIVTTWWIVLLGSTFLGNFVARAWWNAATELEDYRTAYTLDLISMCTDIVAALLAIVFVRAATRRQHARAEQIARGENVPGGDGTRPAAEEPDFTIEPAWKPSGES